MIYVVFCAVRTLYFFELSLQTSKDVDQRFFLHLGANLQLYLKCPNF